MVRGACSGVPGLLTLHKLRQENIGGTVCATGVCFGGFGLDSLGRGLESDGWTYGRVKVPPVSELHSGKTGTPLPQHVGRNQHLGPCFCQDSQPHSPVFSWRDASFFLTPVASYSLTQILLGPRGSWERIFIYQMSSSVIEACLPGHPQSPLCPSGL